MEMHSYLEGKTYVEVVNKQFPELEYVRFKGAIRFIQQHLWCNFAAVVIWMVEAITKNGKAYHKSLFRSTVFWKSN
jgi:hypothetical protein